MFESLDEKFDVEHESAHPDVPESKESTELEVYVVGEKSAIDYDTDLARNTLHDLLAKGSAAVARALEIAESSEHPRAYEVAGAFIKNVSDVARDLMEIQKARKVIDKPEAGTKPVIKQQNNFFGTTKDLLKAMDAAKTTAVATVDAEVVE